MPSSTVHVEDTETALRVFERFVWSYHLTVFRLVVGLLGDPAAAEKMTEDLFLEFWHQCGPLPATAEVLGAAVDRCLHEAAPAQLVHALRQIDKGERIGWLLHDVLQLPPTRIAGLLGRPVSDIRSDVHRTRWALGRQLTLWPATSRVLTT